MSDLLGMYLYTKLTHTQVGLDVGRWKGEVEAHGEVEALFFRLGPW